MQADDDVREVVVVQIDLYMCSWPDSHQSAEHLDKPFHMPCLPEMTLRFSLGVVWVMMEEALMTGSCARAV